MPPFQQELTSFLKATTIFGKQENEGLIVNISSALAVFNPPLRTMISSSKAGQCSISIMFLATEF